MLKAIGADQAQAFQNAVREILPILCFAPDAVEAFLTAYLPGSDGRSYVVEADGGGPTFCRYSVDGSEVFVDYIIPSKWDDRYAQVRCAIEQLKDACLTPGSDRYIRMHVDERLPSHAAYYLGLLPELGFTLKPRVTMTAPRDLTTRLIRPDLAEGVTEVSYHRDRLPAVIDVSVRAYSGKMLHELPEAEWDRLRQDEAPYLEGAFAQRRAADTWTGLAFQDRLVACSFGEVTDDRLKVEEVFVLPEFQGKGLGRHVTVRCLQKLHEQDGSPSKRFFLGTDRRWTPALNLYHSLGFSIDVVESYALLHA